MINIDKVTPLSRKTILLISDITSTLLSLFLAYSLLYSPDIFLKKLPLIWPYVSILIGIRLGACHYFGLYNFSWRYASSKEFSRIFSSVTTSSILITVLLYGLQLRVFPARILLIDWAFVLIGIGGVRSVLRLYRDYLTHTHPKSIKNINLIIIGAGDAGEMIARELTRVSSLPYRLIGFIDDSTSKIGKVIQQAPVLGSLSDLPKIVEKHAIKEAIIAIPSAKGSEIRQIISMCETAKLSFKITPGLSDIIGGRISVSQLRNVSLEDLLRRDEINMSLDSVSAYLSGATVLVTGAGGSIGSELCRQISKLSPKALVLLDHDENAIYHIHMELNTPYSTTHIVPLIADTKNYAHLDSLFSELKPDVIFHAAAHKHVPLMEGNIRTAIENNIMGTKNVLDLAEKYQAKECVLISTDKAVRSTNVMGATKRLCEILVQLKANSPHTRFSAVRFGNVLGSRGSVVPLFKKQLAGGGPLTVTHTDMTRFFMTIPEAVRLVIETGALGKGGEIFILDMGKPVRILDLARDLIFLSGLEEGKDIDIEITGLRPGEKLHEELFFNKSVLTKTPHTKIFVTEPASFDTLLTLKKIESLLEFCTHSKPADLRDSLMKTSQEFEPKP